MSVNSTKQVILLINLGTPDSPAVKDVRKYLTEFLNDPRVIDIPWLARKILVNLIIVPFRSPKSAKIYAKLWDEKGSPLLYHTESLSKKLQIKIGEDTSVYFAMRYGNPSIKSVLARMQKQKFEKITVVPLYPQYASSTTGSTIEKVLSVTKNWKQNTEIVFIPQFYNHPKFIEAIIQNAKAFDLSKYDHIVFSYHGLPIRHLDKLHQEKNACLKYNCKEEINEHNTNCYQATCYETTRLLAAQLQIPKEKYTTAFQSRLDKNWLEPFSDKVVEERAKLGDKKILFFSPAFVADCLETTIEIGDEYKEIFIENGGKQLDLVPSLNDGDNWVAGLKDIIAG